MINYLHFIWILTASDYKITDDIFLYFFLELLFDIAGNYLNKDELLNTLKCFLFL